MLTGVMGRAFHDDPLIVWTYGKGRSRDRGCGRYYGWAMRRLVRQLISTTTADRAGAAIWALPGTWRETPREALSLMARNLFAVGVRAPRVLSGLGRVERLHPERPHLYLSILGVEPSRQGEGIGSALIVPGLELSERDNVPAYLETAKERNVGFYAHHGFEVERRLRMPAGGPSVWLMSRRPGGGSAHLLEPDTPNGETR